MRSEDEASAESLKRSRLLMMGIESETRKRRRKERKKNKEDALASMVSRQKSSRGVWMRADRENRGEQGGHGRQRGLSARAEWGREARCRACLGQEWGGS